MTSSARSSSVGLIVKPSVRSTASPIRHTWHLGWDGWWESSRSELLAACAIQRLPRRPPRRVHGVRYPLRYQWLLVGLCSMPVL